MESNWRKNVAKFGRSGNYEPVYPWPDYPYLVAELKTPFNPGGLDVRWVVGFQSPTGRYGTFGFTTVGGPPYIYGFYSYLGTSHFPYGQIVLPD